MESGDVRLRACLTRLALGRARPVREVYVQRHHIGLDATGEPSLAVLNDWNFSKRNTISSLPVIILSWRREDAEAAGSVKY